jgi:hypothetical protein
MSSTQEILRRALEDDPMIVEAVNTEAPSAVGSLSSVLNYIITDAFDLSSEESLWVGYHMGILLTPLANLIPTASLGAVRQEMRTKEYSARLFKRKEYPDAVKIDSAVKYAPIEDWVESLSEIVLSSYPELRPMIRSSIIGSIHGLLTELGLNSNPKKSRGSLYLPNAVRHLLGSRRD